MAFEYKITQFNVLTKFSLEKELNKVGADGWSAMQVEEITKENEMFDTKLAGRRCFEVLLKKEHNERSF